MECNGYSPSILSNKSAGEQQYVVYRTRRFCVFLWGGGHDEVIIIKFCTRVHVCYVIILAFFGVDVSRDVDSVRRLHLRL